MAGLRSMPPHLGRLKALERDSTMTLMRAAAEGNLVAVKRVLASGQSTETRNNKGCTPLMWAAVNGHLAVVKALLAAGANVNAVNEDGRSVLMVAASGGHAGVVHVLIHGGANVKLVAGNGETALNRAKNPAIIKLLHRAGASS